MKQTLFSSISCVAILLLVTHIHAQVYDDTGINMAGYTDGYAYASGLASELTAAEQNQPITQPTEPFTPAQPAVPVASVEQTNDLRPPVSVPVNQAPVATQQAPMEYVNPAPGGLTNEEVARILMARSLYQLLGINKEAATPAAQITAFNDLATRALSTNFIRPEDKDKVVEFLIRVADIIDSKLRESQLRIVQPRELGITTKLLPEKPEEIESKLEAAKDMSALLKQQQNELNQDFNEYLKLNSSKGQLAAQPSTSTAPEPIEKQEGEKKPKKVTFNPNLEEVHEIEAVGKQRPVGRRFS